MQTATEIIGYAAVLAVVEQQVAGRAGISTGSLRVLTRISTLIETGATVRAADVVAAKAAAPSETRQNLKRLLATKHLERRGGPVKGRLLIPEEGRRVLAELVRGIQRARKQLMSFEPCPPFRRVVPKKATKLPDDAQKGKEGETHDPEVPLSPHVQNDLLAVPNVARTGESKVY